MVSLEDFSSRSLSLCFFFFSSLSRLLSLRFSFLDLCLDALVDLERFLDLLRLCLDRLLALRPLLRLRDFLLALALLLLGLRLE